MSVHAQAGKRPVPEDLANIPRIVADYYSGQPDPNVDEQRVKFGTSGHRGRSSNSSFNDAHIAAISQAIAEYRSQQGHKGPLFLGMDTHALSEPAWQTAMEVFAANDVPVHYQQGRRYTPTPVISRSIIAWNREHPEASADGVVITPSHNPPEDGGFKYNPPHGGPAGQHVTAAIAARANELLEARNEGVRRVTLQSALRGDSASAVDLVLPYVDGLSSVLDMAAIEAAQLSICADPMGGAAIDFWGVIAERHGLDIEVAGAGVDPTFRFMTRDKDGAIRMDCSSPWAMAGLLERRSGFDIAFGNDPDADRHGIVTRAGLMNPNSYIAVAVDYLFSTRSAWSDDLRVGKTLVTSALVDRVAARLGRQLYEVPVGFKWFCEGLHGGALGFGGEESAGASFLCFDGTPWSTDKDGIVMNLLAAEMTAKTGLDPHERWVELTDDLGAPLYERLQAPANSEQKAVLKRMDASAVQAETLAGDTIRTVMTSAPGNNAAIGGLKVSTDNGWFAARPSGTEDIYKIYTESFVDEDHLKRIQDEARSIVQDVLNSTEAR